MDKVKRFFKSKFGFALTLSLIFCLVQIPVVLHHEPVHQESVYYYTRIAALGISYAWARFIPLAFTTVIVFLLSLILPTSRLAKVCIAFSSLLFYFNSVLLVGFRLVPFGRELVFSNPLEFFRAINEAFYHTFLPVAQLCLIPIMVYLLDCILHFKWLRQLEIIKLAKRHHLSGLVVFLIPIALSIPNALISAGEDLFGQYHQLSVVPAIVQEFNELPAGAVIIYDNDAIQRFATTYNPLLTEGRHFLETESTADFLTELPADISVYYLIPTSYCSPTRNEEPQSQWEYRGTVRQLGDGTRAYDFYRVQ